MGCEKGGATRSAPNKEICEDLGRLDVAPP
jgi:hypothetical protein